MSKLKKSNTKDFPKTLTKRSFGKGLKNSFSKNKLESYDFSNTMVSPQ